MDVKAGTITVSAIGYWPPVPMATARIKIMTNERTRFVWARRANISEVAPPTIEDVVVGEKIAVQGMVRQRVHLATQVMLRLPNNER